MTDGEANRYDDMTPDAFRTYGVQVIDMIADYLAHLESRPVLSREAPSAIKARLPKIAPESPESMEAILQDVAKIVLPGLTHWNHPGFFAYFANSAPGPGILAEALCAAFNQNGMLWKTSPVATEMEEVATGWLGQMMGLPEAFRGILADTASTASLLSIAAARERIPGLNIREEGMSGRAEVPRLRVYASEQAHSSIEKAAITLGVGRRGVRKIPTDTQLRMNPSALSAAIQEDLQNGWAPFCVVGTVGTTSTTAIDPIPDLAAICKEHGLWLHVDAAYGGAAGIVPEFRWILDGCDRADSLVVNPHKWLAVPMDCSVLFLADPEPLRRAFRLVPDYLVTEEEGTNFMDWGFQLGRRFRALKLWMTLRYFGHEGLAAMLRHHIHLAHQFADQIDNSPDFERMALAPLSVVCFRAHPKGMNDEAQLEELNTDLLRAVNASGEVYLSHTRIAGQYVLRLAIGNIHTEEKHVRRAWELLNQQLMALLPL
ncbi:MAG TPA: pyridoxal-dependent decarboxylase [Chthonomonadaceae bacterium]|nr:pyridoxal-dependent decarboxylase [Chthonomonadaceae bacterium]